MQRAKPEHKRQAKLICRAHWLKYRSEIMKAKTKSWAKFVTEVGNTEPWGFVYKHQTKRLRTEKVDKNQEEVRSYRPLCLLSAIGKVFERVLLGRLQRTVYIPVMLSKRQLGFRQGMSTEDAIIELRKSLDSHNEAYVLGLLFDISGAFDNV